MKKLMKKKNNKGFSLVELIVVVLILGIIAVALAPQVMKWVGTARTNSDENTKKDIKSAVQLAVADWQKDYTAGGEVVYEINGTGISVQSGSTDWSATDSSGNTVTLMDVIKNTMGDTKLKPNEGSKFMVKIFSSGVVAVDIDNVPTN